MAKRGRRRHEHAIRTPTGRKSRSVDALKLEERMVLETATWKRRQMDSSLSIAEARLPEHGSVIAGWLHDWNRVRRRYPDAAHPNTFTQIHYDTAMRYHELYLRWLAIAGARNPRSASDFTGPGGFDGADPFEPGRADREARIQADFRAARKVVLESGPLGMMAIETIVIENQPAEGMRGDLRLALNALAVLWKYQAAA